jgi:preprotein translocase subunit SecF
VEFFRKATSFPFMSTRKLWYGLSIALMLVSFVSFYVRGLNLAIDFTGGVRAEAAFSTAANVDAVRAGLAAAGFHEPQVQSFGTSRDVAIRLPSEANQNGAAIRARVEGVLRAIDAGAELRSIEVVGPQVGDELKGKAVQALAAALFLIFCYIALRFHTWRLSLGAILAVLHDPILVLGVFSVTQTPFDLTSWARCWPSSAIAQRHRRRVRPYPRAFRGEPPAGAAPRAGPVDQPDAVAHDHDQGDDVDRRGRPVRARRPGAQGFSEALIIGIVAGTYSIYIERGGAGLRAEASTCWASVKKPVDDLP